MKTKTLSPDLNHFFMEQILEFVEKNGEQLIERNILDMDNDDYKDTFAKIISNQGATAAFIDFLVRKLASAHECVTKN